MNYVDTALKCFQEIVDNTPANSCSLLIHEGGALVDAGCTCPGGWSVAKSVLEGLTGGRGQVGFAQRMVDGAQLPAVELFLDDPEGAAAAFVPGEDGLFGVKDGEEYVLGVSLSGAEAARKARGNVVAAAPDSLLASVLQAAAPIPQAVEALRAAGITDIQWGWSSCPVSPFTHDATAWSICGSGGRPRLSGLRSMALLPGGSMSTSWPPPAPISRRSKAVSSEN